MAQSTTNYKSLQTCLYRISNISESVELNLNFKIERNVNFYDSSSNSCYDYIKLFINGMIYDFGTSSFELCGQGQRIIDVDQKSTVEVLLVTDEEGKYDELDNSDFYEVNPRRTVLNCCASDCESNFKCNCDDDDGNFEIEVNREVNQGQVQRRSTSGLYVVDEWTEWYSTSQPSGVEVAGQSGPDCIYQAESMN